MDTFYIGETIRRLEFEEVKNEQNALIKKTFEENKKIFDKKILEINNDFEDKKKNLTLKHFVEQVLAVQCREISNCQKINSF